MVLLLIVIIVFQAVCLAVLVGLAKRQMSLMKSEARKNTKPLPRHDLLSVREIEVLENICRGLSNREIADLLSLSKRTVDRHRANILEKTACNNTAELVVYSIRNGLIEI